jgi:hypothetical protein
VGRRAPRARCEVCGYAQSNICHHGYPPSLNIGGSGWNPHVFQGVKQAWQGVLTFLLNTSGLPRGLHRVTAEVQIGFPTRGRRDANNFRYVLDKALGDALTEGGWLDDDSFFPEVRYEMAGFRGVHTPREASTRIMLFPAWPDESSGTGTALF